MRYGVMDDTEIDMDDDEVQAQTAAPNDTDATNNEPQEGDKGGEGTGAGDGIKPDAWVPWDADSDGDDDDDGPTDPFADVSFQSVGGLEEQIAWLTQYIVNPLKDKHLEVLWGLQPVKGVLFYGPPGTGKTLLARAFGNEISQLLGTPVTFYHRRGGDLLSKWFGGSAQLIKALFREAKANSPSIIFLDELDGVCPSRDGRGTNQASISVVSSLLSEMDAVVPGTIFVFGATNRVDAIDPAMRRPGRFDKHLQFFLPTLATRKSIIQLHTQKWKQGAPQGDLLDQIAQQTVGFTGADLENLARETFFTAFHRHIPDLDGEDAGTIQDMVITPEDWKTTMERVKASSGSSYGSYLYIPKPASGILNPLISPIQNQIVAKILPYLPSVSAPPAATVKTFYIYDTTAKNSSTFGLECAVLPGLFGHEALSNFPVYMLSAEKILSSYPSGRILTIAEGVLQAVSSSRPCILYVPQIEAMIQLLDPGDVFSLCDHLTHLRGKNILLVASGMGSHHLISNPAIRLLFSAEKSFGIPKSTEQERGAFFEPIFIRLKQKWDSPESAVVLDEMLTSIVERTKGDGIQIMANLHARIGETVVKFAEEEEDFRVAMRQLLTMYSKTKLGI